MRSSRTSAFNTTARFDVLEEFGQAIWAAGLRTDAGLIADGAIHRFHVEGDRAGTTNGWYVIYPDHRPAGAFGSWKTGEKHTWRANGMRMPPATMSALSQKIEADRMRDEARKSVDRDRAAWRANRILDAARCATAEHPYLLRKQIGPHGLRVGFWPQRNLDNVLLVALTDMDGAIVNLQAIFAEPDLRTGRDKDFLVAGRTSGCFHQIGHVVLPPSALIVCEGFATGASIYEQVGHPVLCAMSAGNLLAVAKAARERWPETQVVIAGDNDQHTASNPGLTKAIEAASAVSGRLLVPDFPSRCDGADWNDWARRGWRIPFEASAMVAT